MGGILKKMIDWVTTGWQNWLIVILAISFFLSLVGIGIEEYRILSYKHENSLLIKERDQLKADLQFCNRNIEAIRNYNEEAEAVRKETNIIRQRIRKLENQKGVAEDAEFFKIATDIFSRLNAGLLETGGGSQAVVPSTTKTANDSSGSE